MNTMALSMPWTATVEDTIGVLRSGVEFEAVHYLYVVDEQRKLVGVLSLRQLLVVDGTKVLRDLMRPEPLSAHVLEGRAAVAATMVRYELLCLPITETDGRLLGVVTIDDVLDAIKDEAAEDLLGMAGLAPEERLSDPMLGSARRRVLWSLLNLLTALAACAVVGFFEGSIEKVVALATFMPVVAGLGGNSGTQSLSLMIRALARDELEPGTRARAVLRQLGVGLLVGAVAGAITGVIVTLTKGNPWLGLVLFLAMVINIAIGALVGASVPLLLLRLRLDPALGSGILVTGLTDSLGFLSFLGLATLMMSHLVS